MSTRAIITVKAGGESKGLPPQRLYVHGDGYPSGVGILLHNFTNVSKSMGQGGKVHKKAWGGDFSRYFKLSPRGKAYTGMVNIQAEPDQFMIGLISYLTSKGFGHIYLTDRDPVKEAKEHSTDIDWHYVVTLPGWGSSAKPKVDTYEYNWTTKAFRKKSMSIPEMTEREVAYSRKARRKYERGQKARARKQTKPQSGLRGLR